MTIVYEDSDLIAVEKAAGEVVHPAPGYPTDTMSDRLKAKYPEMAAVGSVERPGVVHRLDKDTSGVMVFARTQRAYVALRKLFESHQGIEKTYLAVCHGSPKAKRGEVKEPIDGKHAFSRYQVLGTKQGVSVIEFTIETGRMHQVRIHAASLGCPIVGDAQHGSRERDSHLRRKPKRTLLHAVRLAFTHPFTHQPLEFISPPPSDIVHAI